MHPCEFEKPVSILVGLGFPRKVANVMEAYQLLGEWPSFSRDPARAVALNACKAALRGEIEAETARSAFVAFARRSGLLAAADHDGFAAAGAGRPGNVAGLRPG